jgi:L-iduronidase
MGHPSTQWEPGGQSYDIYFQGQKSDEYRYFTDFKDDKQIRAWKDLVKAMALHFIDRYGEEEVRSWYFETWNEPNLKQFWPFGLEGLINYYDACSEGLREADSLLVFGGPGTAGAPNNDTFKEVLNHCEYGINYFTGEKGVRLDFISYHIKARVRFMTNNELEVIEHIRQNNPSLVDIPLINNEADPIAGWGRKFFWRPGPWYASFVVHSIDHHNKYIIDNEPINYRLLSNDNGFMGDWYRRTHFARFIENNDDQLSLSENFYLVKKPVYSVMGLLTTLGNERFKVELDNRDRHYGIIPTKNENGDIILALYNSPLIEITYKRPVSKEKEYIDE